MQDYLPENAPAPVSAAASDDHVQQPFTKDAVRGEGTEFSGDKIPVLHEITSRISLPNYLVKQVFGSRVLIIPDAAERMKGTIILVDSAIEKPSRGVVVATGEGRVIESGHIVPNNAQVGDHVLYGKHSGTEIDVDGYLFLIIQDSDIFMSLEPKEKVEEQPLLIKDLPKDKPKTPDLVTEGTGMKHTRHNSINAAIN